MVGGGSNKFRKDKKRDITVTRGLTSPTKYAGPTPNRPASELFLFFPSRPFPISCFCLLSPPPTFNSSFKSPPYKYAFVSSNVSQKRDSRGSLCGARCHGLLLLMVLFLGIAHRLLLFHRLPPSTSTTPALIRSAMSGSDSSTPRMVVKRVLAKQQHEGQGAVVRRSIGRNELRNLDPFLMLDEFSVSPPAGFPDHPHRGFETVTYMLQGALTHQDFAGNKGTIRTGDVQWMTAGRGIIHSEMPAGEGVNKGLQLWINLSSRDKMIEPRYQELLCEDIGTAEDDGVEVRVIAGEAMGVRSPVYTRTPTMYLDFTLKPGARLNQSIPESWTAFVYVIEGEGVFGSGNSSPVPSHNLLVLGPGDGVSVWNESSKPLRFVLIGGQPLNEPVVQHGPFVMNTPAQIDQAIEDHQYGKNGFEMAKHWRSRSVG